MDNFNGAVHKIKASPLGGSSSTNIQISYHAPFAAPVAAPTTTHGRIVNKVVGGDGLYCAAIANIMEHAEMENDIPFANTLAYGCRTRYFDQMIPAWVQVGGLLYLFGIRSPRAWQTAVKSWRRYLSEITNWGRIQ